MTYSTINWNGNGIENWRRSTPTVEDGRRMRSCECIHLWLCLFCFLFFIWYLPIEKCCTSYATATLCRNIHDSAQRWHRTNDRHTESHRWINMWTWKWRAEIFLIDMFAEKFRIFFFPLSTAHCFRLVRWERRSKRRRRSKYLRINDRVALINDIFHSCMHSFNARSVGEANTNRIPCSEVSFPHPRPLPHPHLGIRVFFSLWKKSSAKICRSSTFLLLSKNTREKIWPELSNLASHKTHDCERLF